jgi:hypothetical protein
VIAGLAAVDRVVARAAVDGDRLGRVPRVDEVVEVVLNGVPANRAELERYGLSEEIISYKRRWFVVLDDAPAVLPDLLAQRRPIRGGTAVDHPVQ